MKLVGRLKTELEIEKLNQLGIDVFCLDTTYSIKRISNFSENDLINITKSIKSLDKEVYVYINKMIHEDDLLGVKVLMKLLKQIEIDGIIINDLTVYLLAKKYDLDNKIIFQPGTLNTDSYSAQYFSDRKIKGITLSREITLEEIKTITSQSLSLEYSLIGHGYIDMFYSRRELLTNYYDFKQMNKSEVKNNYNFKLNEEIRDKQYYPILEDDFGTYIFRSNKLISVNEIEQLNDRIHDFYIERIFMSDQEYYDSIRLYNNMISANEFLKEYKNYDSGFYYKRTEKIKGDNNES